MSILVTGGAGYIGSHTVKELLAQGETVVVIDNLSTGHRESLGNEVSFIEGDIRDQSVLDQLFSTHDIEAVIHFAAYSLVGESVQKPLDYYDNNLIGAHSLVTAMVRHGVKRIVFSSTAATYGEPNRVPIEEDDPTEPTNPYGETKLAMERLFRWCDQAYGIKSVSLRYFNAAGAYPDSSIGEDHKPESHLIPLILQVPLGQREHITMFGDDYPTEDGTCVRDYIHVMDLANAHWLALKSLRENSESEVYNLGNGTGFTVKEVIEVARLVTGHPIPAVAAPRRQGDPAILIASSDKIRKRLGWQPRFADLRTIIQTAWDWHSRSPRGYESE